MVTVLLTPPTTASCPSMVVMVWPRLPRERSGRSTHLQQGALYTAGHGWAGLGWAGLGWAHLWVFMSKNSTLEDVLARAASQPPDTTTPGRPFSVSGVQPCEVRP